MWDSLIPRRKLPSGTVHRELTARNGDVTLAGSLWLPDSQPAATVLMHPGSGPSNRDNDVYFPQVRAHLLDRGFALCSFDKRGVGESTGSWLEADIVEQAHDVAAAVATLRAVPDFDAPIGLFGHSQGGWVVLEAQRHVAPLAFVVTNSGPGVTPAAQERGVPMVHRSANAVEWAFASSIMEYDPRQALSEVRVPLLALLGADDVLVPVEASVAVFREVVAPDLLTVVVIPGGDHRIQSGDPLRPADGYLETLSSFIAGAR